jgi:hypothetical protein
MTKTKQILVEIFYIQFSVDHIKTRNLKEKHRQKKGDVKIQIEYFLFDHKSNYPDRQEYLIVQEHF